MADLGSHNATTAPWYSATPGAYDVAPFLSPFLALAVAIAIVLGSQLLAVGGASVLGLMPTFHQRQADPNAILPLLLTQQVLSIALVVLALLVRRRLTYPTAAQGFLANAALGPPRQGPRAYARALFIIVSILTATFGLVMLTGWNFLLDDLKSGASLVRGERWVLTFLVLVVGAPLAEELLFRGLLTAALAKSPLGFWPGAMIANVFWTALHMQYSYIGLAEIALIGIVFTALLAWSGSLWVPIFAHAVYNGLLFFIVRFLPLPI
jgi:membrane protease YdiL (CAAX protease family)